MKFKTALVVALVVLLVLVGLPVLMPGMGAACADCPPAVAAGVCVLGFLSGLALWALVGSQIVGRETARRHLLLWVTLFERPPQLV